MTPAVSIIVPVYNVEKYMAQCAMSLFTQTLDRLEFIFIDDCSPDDSIKVMQSVLEQYPYRKDAVKVLCNDHNLGQAKTRKRGILASSGEYVIHCDPDDWVDRDLYEVLYKEAVGTGSDVVMCDAYREYPDGRSVRMNMSSPMDRVSLFKDLYMSRRMGALWATLTARRIVLDDTIVWPQWNYTEDLTLVFQYLVKASKFSYVNGALYHYRDNNESISYKNSETLKKDYIRTYALIDSRCKEIGLYEELRPQRLYRAFKMKGKSIHASQGSDVEAQRAWLSESPELGFMDIVRAEMPLKQKVYATILMLHLLPVVNRFVSIRHRIMY